MPSSPKKGDGVIVRRRRSSESVVDDSYSGTRVLTFATKGLEHVVHCGKCLGE